MSYRRVFSFLLCLNMVISVCSPLPAADKILMVNVTGVPPLNTPDQTGFADLVVSKALARIGYKLQTVTLPAERGLINVNAGIEDAEMMRIAGLEKTYPNLIRVPEKILDWDFHAFSKKNIKLENSWDSLKGNTVAYINGWKIFERNVPSKVESLRVKNLEQLFNLVKLDRSDIILYEHWGGLHQIKESGLQGVKIISPPLDSREMFMYLHKKHKHLVPELVHSLKSLKADGTYKKIYDMKLMPLAK